MRPAAVVLVVLLAACRRDAATGTAPVGGTPRSGAPKSLASQSLSVSDEELVAFARWQRDYMDLFRRQRAEIDAVGSADPDWFIRDPKGFEAAVAEVVARQIPVMKAVVDRVPLKGEKAELVTEAIGGIFHFERAFNLVIARDDVRLEAARRRFGKQAIDDIVVREPLILAALQQP